MTTLHETAVATDTKLAELHQVRAKLLHAAASAESMLRHAAGHRRVQSRTGLRWAEPLAELLAVDPASLSVSRAHDFRKYLQQRNESLAAAGDVDDAIAALEDVWYVNGCWSRFFLVISSDGHIHSSMQCATCRPATVFGWLPDVSGLTESEAVAAHGEILCSVCFPTAPVAWTEGEAKVSREVKAARATAKAARDAAKLTKALLADGSELVVVIESDGRYVHQPRVEKFSTLAAAKTWLTNAAEWNKGGGHPSYPPHAVAEVAAAVAAKLGTTSDVEITEAAKRAAKRT